MAPVTEIVKLPLKEGLLSDDAGSKKFQGVLHTIMAQDGCQGLRWGAQVETPSIMNLFIDWDSIDHHQKFIDSAEYKPFFDDIVGIVSGDVSFFHAQFDPHPPSTPLADGNATEYLTLYFPADYSVEDQRRFDADMKEFAQIVQDACDGFRGGVTGWVVEELEDPKSSQKSKVCIMLIGWTSVETHLKFRETQAFKDNIYYLRGAKDLMNLTVWHVLPKKE